MSHPDKSLHILTSARRPNPLPLREGLGEGAFRKARETAISYRWHHPLPLIPSRKGRGEVGLHDISLHILTCVMVLFAALMAVSIPSPALALDFTAAEKRKILRHGPWPQAEKPDPSNRVSGKPAAILFGRALFYDLRLSTSGKVSCAVCHQPLRAWTDGVAKSSGHAEVDRNALGLVNLRFHRWFGWDGGQDSLWAQNLRPLLDQREMGIGVKGAAALVRGDRTLSCLYRHSFGSLPGQNDQRVFVDLGKAMAAFVETLVTGRTPFDDFRDALAKGNKAAMARYPAAAKRGLRLFVGKGNCAFCHFGPTFTNGEFADAGVSYFIRKGVVDQGRYGGIRRLRKSPYNLLGPFNDDPARSTAVKTRHVRLTHRNYGEFRVPGLRNVAQTAPYMHNGSLKTLADVVRHYSEINEERLHADGEQILRRLNLTAREQADLVSFLVSLTEKNPDSPTGGPNLKPVCQ